MTNENVKCWCLVLESGAIFTAMKEENFIALDWNKVPDLTGITTKKALRDAVRQSIEKDYKDETQAESIIKKFERFVFEVTQEEILLVIANLTPLALGKVKGKYYYEQQAKNHKHRISVEWMLFDKDMINLKDFKSGHSDKSAFYPVKDKGLARQIKFSHK